MMILANLGATMLQYHPIVDGMAWNVESSDDYNVDVARITDVITFALRCLENARQELHRPKLRREVHEAFQLYFKPENTPMGPLGIATLRRTLNRVQSGLQADKYFQLEKNGSTSGAVCFKNRRLGAAPGDHTIRKMYRSKANGAGRSRSKIHTGAIRINPGHYYSVDNRRYAATTLIHEATHRYADTEGWYYLSTDGSIQDQSESVHGSRLKSLANADSYAQFYVRIGLPGN